jgi:hypothetical protein
MTSSLITFGGTSSDAANSIEIDSSGDFYVTGNFSGASDIASGAGTIKQASQNC